MPPRQDTPNKTAKSSRYDNMVSVRMDPEVRNLLDFIGEEENLKRSDIARAYLNLCETAKVKTNQEIQLFDGTPLSLFPLDKIRFILQNIKSADKIELGDQLGALALQNCGLRNKRGWDTKLEFVSNLGWFKIHKMVFPDESDKQWRYHTIICPDFPLDILHALLYRLITRERLQNSVTVANLEDNSFRRMRKPRNNEQEFRLFMDNLGPSEENLDPNAVYLKFEAFKEAV